MPRAAIQPVQEEKPRSVQCQPGRLKLMEHAHNFWSVHAPSGAIPDDVSKSDFWSLMSAKLRPYDRFEVLADDGTWLVSGMILSCSRNWAEIFVRETLELGKASDPSVSATLKAEWKGPEHKWCVIRIKDGAMLQEGLETSIAANQWLTEHENKVK